MTAENDLALLRLEQIDEGRYAVHQPSGSPEGGNVVFGGQLMAQTIMAAEASSGGKYVKAMSTVFSRAGKYAEPIHLTVDSFQAGRTFAGDVVTAWQGTRLLTRSMVMLTSDEPDLISHQLERPSGVTAPERGEPAPAIVFPGAEARTAHLADEFTNGVPVMAFWTRMAQPVSSTAMSQAILAYATNGHIIGLAMRAHPDSVRIEDAHHTLSTGVVGHSLSFHRDFDAGDWLLLVHEATFAGRGRVHGRGTVYGEDGTLVASFTQEAMVKAAAPAAGSGL